MRKLYLVVRPVRQRDFFKRVFIPFPASYPVAMNEYRQPGVSGFDRLTGTLHLSGERSVVIKQTYILFGLSVASALAGGYVGATSETMVRLFSNWLGWILALVLLNVVPRIAIAVRHNPVLGVGALVFDGFISGIAISPLLWIASRVMPES